MQTAPLDFRLATRADEALLIALMREFYAEDKIEFDDARVRRGVDALLADPRNGEVLLWLDEAGEVCGYAVIAMGFSEVFGFTCFAIGAQYLVGVTSVLASQFAPIAAIMAYLLFKERLGRIQIAGVAVIVLGVVALTLVST